MDKLIHELRKYPYSGNDILTLLDGKTKILLYSDLKKFNNIDQVFDPYDCVVILYEMKKSYGHWVCLIRFDNKIEYFDPYGKPPDNPLDYVKPELKQSLGEDYPYLSKLLNDSPYKIVYNSYPLQKLSKEISSCGRHVGLRLSMKDYPLNKYVKIITGGELSPDDTVTYLTAFN